MAFKCHNMDTENLLSEKNNASSLENENYLEKKTFINWENEEKEWKKEMNRIKFDRIYNKITNIRESSLLDSVSWKDEFNDKIKRIIPTKTINLWRESMGKSFSTIPTGTHLLDLIKELENRRILITRKGLQGSFKSVIKYFDIIDFLNRDFLYLGELNNNSSIPTREEYNWCGTSSPYSSQTDADCIYQMITVINNKIFYLDSLIWEMDCDDKFSKNIYFNITVYDINR